MKGQEDEQLQQTRQSKNPIMKFLHLLSHGLSWLLILPILFYRQFISPFTPRLVALHLPVQSMPDKQ